MSVKNSKGQMAIFFVLIFQILFILFAMTINVALVTHDKINLQNSLDLAAIYGAKKQAEVLNAMAHINYQMRQNYKLLAWRYRILGSMANPRDGNHPEGWCPGSSNRSLKPCDTRGKPQCNNSIYPNNYCDRAYSICVNAPIWAWGKNASDYCQNNNIKVPRIPDLKVLTSGIPGLGFNDVLARRVKESRLAIANTCSSQSDLSWLMTQVFLSHFRLDQKDRKIMMQAIYDKTLKQGRDLDGNLINGGAEKVFKKNLTHNNLKNYNQPVFFNSLENKSFREFLNPLNLFSFLQYMHLEGTCSGSTFLHTKRKQATISSDFANFYKAYENLFNLNEKIYSTPNDYIGTLTLGYEKNQKSHCLLWDKSRFPLY